MNITVNNTKLFNFYIGMAKRIVNRRDSMGNPILGYIRVSADMQSGTVTIESNDIVSGIRLTLPAADLGAEISEDGSVLLSEGVCDWLKGARQPLVISRNGTVDSGRICCGCETLDMRDNDFDELEFLEIRDIPDKHEEIRVDAVSFCRGLRACAQHADPSTLTSQGVVLECGNGEVDISSVSANGAMMAHYRMYTPSDAEVRIILDGASVAKAVQTLLNSLTIRRSSSLTLFVAGNTGCWLSSEGIMVYTHALSSPGFNFRTVSENLTWYDSAVFAKNQMLTTLALRKRGTDNGGTLGLYFRDCNLVMESESGMGVLCSDIPCIRSSLSNGKEKILVDTKCFLDTILKLPDAGYDEIKIRLEEENAESSPLRIENGAYTAFLAPKVLR